MLRLSFWQVVMQGWVVFHAVIKLFQTAMSGLVVFYAEIKLVGGCHAGIGATGGFQTGIS